MTHLASPVLAGLGLLLAGPAFATSIGSASVEYALDLPGNDGVSIDVSDGVTTSDSSAGGAGIEEVFAENDDLSGSIFAGSRVDGVGFAQARADASSFFTVENTGGDPLSYAFDLVYSITTEASSLSTDDDVFAGATLSVMDDFGDTVFETSLSFDAFDLGQNALSGTETISLSLDPFGFNSAEIFAEISTGATSSAAPAAPGITPVPLPAAGWLLLAGFGGLAAMRRRAA